MARLHIHPVGLGLIFFGLLSWVVALGGLAASTAYCNDNKPENDPSFCARSYQLEWWSIWFEFFLLLIMLLTCFTNAFDRGRFIFLTYLAMVTVLLTIMARNFITNSFSYAKYGVNFGDKKADAYNAAAAGSVLLCIVNYSLIIFVGLGATSAATGQQGAGYTPGFSLASLGLGGATAAGYSNPNPGLGVGGSSAPVDKYQPSNF